jgi:hypothetical protein
MINSSTHRLRSDKESTINEGRYIWVKGAAPEKQLTQLYTWLAKARRISIEDMKKDSALPGLAIWMTCQEILVTPSPRSFRYSSITGSSPVS